LWDYFEKFIKNYQDKASEKSIEIKLERLEKLEIENNIYYLDRLFWNLLSNAIFYNNWNNEITIRIKKNWVEIIDKWIWIEKKDLNKIFNRFYRNSDSWIYYKNWNGLGLTIAKKICDMFWWKTFINSEIWKGTNFMIEMLK
jgi:signal transduction histidine kinase